MTGARKALTLSFLEKYTAVAIYAASSAVMSRILTPRDIGLFSVGFAVTALVSQFRDFGVATFLIQEPELTNEKIRAVLGMSFATSLAVGILLVSVSGLAGAFYHERGVTVVILITSTSLLLIPFNSIMVMWLRRQMQYGTIYRMTLVGVVAQTIVTIGFGLAGMGYMSMAWGSVANTVGITLVGARHWPREFSFVPSFKAWAPIASIGVYSTVGNLGVEITPRSTDLFVGRLIGITGLGEFSRASSLVGFVSSSLISAALPVALSVLALKRRSNESISSAYLLAVSHLTAFAWPAFTFTAIMTFPVIRILFGGQWDVAVLPARILAIAALVTSLIALHPSVFQAAGAMRQRMIVQLAVTPAQMIVFFIGAHFGLLAVAVAAVFSAVVEFIPSQIAVNRIAGTTMRDVGKVLVGSLLVTAGSSILPLSVFATMAPSKGNIIPMTVLASLGALVGWFASINVLKHPVSQEVNSAFRQLRLQLGRLG